jgi:RimJ/RimL family protein N-acetyltransferase
MKKFSPTLLKFPDRFASPRLNIRLPLPGDGEEVNKAIQETFDLLKMWMPWATSLPTPVETEEKVRRSNSRFLLREDLQLLLFDKNSNELIGSSGLHRGDWEVPRFEIGYWIRKKYLNQGFAKEAVTAVTEFAFTELKARRLEIHVSSHNKASSKVALASGYDLEATLKNYELSLIDGSVVDKLVYAKVR